MKRSNLFVLGIITMLVIASVGAIRTQATRLVFSPLAYTIPANAGARPDGVAVYTVVTPSKSANYFSCADTGGCYVYLTEANARNGSIFRLFNTSANTITIFEASGVREMSSDWVGGQYDNMELQYMTDRWVQTNEHNN